jgi:nucleotide-binding universal stress UspA family protein
MPLSSPPFRSILVPLDGSSEAEQALPLATTIAQGAGAKLRLALVHQIPVAPLDPGAAKYFVSADLRARRWERAYLRGVQATLRQAGTRRTSAVTMTGAAGPALAQYVSAMGIDLVVMATHGRGGVQRAWLGSVADYLVRHLKVPVLLTRPTGETTARRPARPGPILVPLDGSALAEGALGPAAGLAKCWQTGLTLLRVVHPVPLSTDAVLPIPSAYDEEFTSAERSQARGYLDDLVSRLQGDGIRATGAAVLGWGTVESILEAASPGRVSAIVLATHGRGGFRRLALGSVADKLVRAARVPVMVYHAADGRSGSKRSPLSARGRRSMAMR